MPNLATLRNVATTDQYADPPGGCGIIGRGANSGSYTIANAAVYMQMLGRMPGGMSGAWGLEEFITPGAYFFDGEQVDGVRFRSAAVGVPAQVSATLQP